MKNKPTVANLEKKIGKHITFVACWNCNKTNIRFKYADFPICCWKCGKLFYDGKEMDMIEEMMKLIKE